MYGVTIVNATQAAAYYDQQPKKRVVSWILIFDKNDRVLVVKPSYLEHWLYPGGGADANEPPITAARRELRAELGVEPDPLRLAYVNYLSPQPTGQNDMVAFALTTNPVMGDAFLASLQLQTDEIDEARFVGLDELHHYVGEHRAKPTRTYVQSHHNHGICYMEDGTLSVDL